MTSCVAMIKACDMAGNIDVVVTTRTSNWTRGSGQGVPMIMVCYDSRVDKLQKVKNLFTALDVSGTTPEGLCFEAIEKDLIPGNSNQDSYFINFSDGQPWYSNDEINYSGDGAEAHTKKMCDKHDKKYYKDFKSKCDNYFSIKHRNEKRGVGGIFFDNLNLKEISYYLSFINDVGETYLSSYMNIVQKRFKKKFNENHKNFQLYRRGRYVEFNLVYDRGTLFGLQSGGRADSILMSLPPMVSWSSLKSKTLLKYEKNLQKYLKIK